MKKYYCLKRDVVEIRPFVLGENTENLYIKAGHTPAQGDQVLIMESITGGKFGASLTGHTFMDLIPAEEFAAQFVQVPGIVANIDGEKCQVLSLAIQESARAAIEQGSVDDSRAWLSAAISAAIVEGQIFGFDAGMKAALEAGQPAADLAKPAALEAGQPAADLAKPAALEAGQPAADLAKPAALEAGQPAVNHQENP